MNTDPLWQGLAFLALGQFIIGAILIMTLGDDGKDDTGMAFGCAWLLAGVLGGIVAAGYIFWYLHVKIV